MLAAEEEHQMDMQPPQGSNAVSSKFELQAEYQPVFRVVCSSKASLSKA